jgi:hypothetical protein
MSQQNLLSVGWNISDLKHQADEVKAIVTDVYNTLKGYDNQKLSPINVSGLTELTSAIQAQKTQMDALTTTIANLGVAMGNYNNMVNASNNTNNVNITGLTSTNNALALLTQTLNQNTAAITANNVAKRSAGNASNSLAATMGKNALKENDLYQQLINKRNLLETQYTNSILNKDPKDKQQGLANQLRVANIEINTVNKALEKTGGNQGLAGLGRGMGSFLNQIRQVAYILPGIGMAGIFNLAFEAVGDLFNGMSSVNRSMDEIIQDQIKYNNLLNEEKKILKDLDDEQNKLNQTYRQSPAYEKQTAEIIAKAGVPPEQQAAEERVISEREYLQSQTAILNQYGDYKNLQSKIQENINIQDQYSASYDKLVEERKKLDTKQDTESKRTRPGIAPREGAGSRFDTDARKKALDADIQLRKQQIETTKQTVADQQKMLDTFIAGDKLYGEKKLTENKLLYDDIREQTLANAELEYNKNKEKNDKIIGNQLSTHEQIINAIKSESSAEIKIADARLNYVLTKREHSQAEETQAQDKHTESLYKNKIDTNSKLEKVDLDYWNKMHEYQIKGQEDIYKTQELYYKALYDDDQESYEKRIDAFGKYNQARVNAAEAQYKSDVETIKKNIPDDEQRKAAINERTLRLQEEYANIENGIRKQSYDIAVDYYKKQVKDIEDFDEKSINEARDAETTQLALDNDNFAKRKISYKKYMRERAEDEYNGEKAILEATIKADQDEITKLQSARKELQAKQGGAIAGMFGAFGDPRRYEQALGEAQGLGKDLEQNQKDINEKTNTLSKDQLALQELQQKATIEAEKQTSDNWKQLEEEAFKDVQEVGDSFYEHRIEQIEKMTEIYDKAADAEIEAINRSTLAAKDKNAYEVQLHAQKEARDKAAAKEERKLKHDEAVFNRAVSIAQIITNTEVAITGAMAQVGIGGVTYPVALAEAISFAALGAAALATAVATKIPSYKYGGKHEKSGLALFGEAGAELVQEPGILPYIAKKPTLKHLPANTELIPLYQIPEIPEKRDSSWEQTLYLGKAIAKSKKEIRNIFKPKINIDLGKQQYINSIIHG